MAVPDATIMALIRALEGLKIFEGVGIPVGYQPCKCCESVKGMEDISTICRWDTWMAEVFNSQ